MAFEIRRFERKSVSPAQPATETFTSVPVPARVVEIVEAPPVSPEPTEKPKRKKTHWKGSARPGRKPKETLVPRLDTPEPKTPTKRRAKHAFQLPDARPASKTLYGIHERIGTGAMLPCVAFPNSTLRKQKALDWFAERAAYWLEQGYGIEWHDQLRWFIATHEDEPTVYCALQEACNER